MHEQHEVADRQQDAQLGRADLEVAHLERAELCVARNISTQSIEVGDEQAERDHRAHVAGEREAAEQERRAERVDDVVDVEAVARPLVLADARERAVEAVAEPVERQADDHETSADGVDAREPVGDTGAEHRHEREHASGDRS